MNSIIQEIQNEKDERIYSKPARDIIKELTPLPSYVEMYKKRWFWELLQNASDYNDEVVVEIEITEDKLIFRHNGRPFSTKDALNLIAPDTAKENPKEDKVIGKFGTGFLSTHILSYLITVEGFIKQKDSGKLVAFKYDLNREKYKDRDFLMKSLQKSEEELQINRKKSYDDKGLNTSFTYHLKHCFDFVDNEDAISIGLDFLEEALPYVFAFMQRLRKVTLSDHRKESKYKVYQPNNISNDKVTITEIHQGMTKNELEITKVINIYFSSHWHFTDNPGDSSQVALKVIENKIVPLKKDFPKLFCVFPMIGTETFPLPFVCNSHQFQPKRERDGIEISQNDTVNRKLLQLVESAFQNLLENVLAVDEISGFYNICKLRKPNFPIPVVNNWYKTSITNKIKNKILINDLITDDTGSKNSLKETFIPSDKIGEDSFWDFYELVIKTNFYFPEESSVKEWHNAVSFELFPDRKFDLDKLLKIIKNKRFASKELLKKFLAENTELEEWISQFIHYLIKNEKVNKLNEIALIPNISGGLKKMNEELYWDIDINNDLKIIYKHLSGISYNNILIDNALKPLKQQILKDKERDNKFISREIDIAIREYKGDKKSKKYVEALRLLFDFADNIDQKILQSDFQWFFDNRGILFMETFGNSEIREMNFSILQSGKIKTLSEMAKSELSEKELGDFVNNAVAIKNFLKWKNHHVEDKEHADEIEGDIGEEIVYNDLKNKFSDAGYRVEWTSKEKGTKKYDFEIWQNETIIYYVDAKTTNQGIHNSNTIPFFMRQSQWNFLFNERNIENYIVARVFLNGKMPEIKYLGVKKQLFEI